MKRFVLLIVIFALLLCSSADDEEEEEEKIEEKSPDGELPSDPTSIKIGDYVVYKHTSNSEGVKKRNNTWENG